MITTQPSMQEQTLETVDALPWYGIRTRSNCERLVAGALENRGLRTFLPLVRARRGQSHCPMESMNPLFPGYVFCRFDLRRRVPVLSAPGVVSIIGFGKEPAAIPEVEIEAVQALMKSRLPFQGCAYLTNGQRVRIRCGALQGIEGILVKKLNEWRLVVSVALLQRSVEVEVNSAWVSVV
jgi:transcription antitermination factor NusG